MDEDTRRKLIWGWLRLLLGFVQMSLVAAALGAFLAVGLRLVTLIFCLGATAATVISCLIYKGRKES